jgi:hypothetical protein
MTSIIPCVISPAKKLTKGRISVGKSVFFTRFVFATIEFVLEMRDSLNNVHGSIPQRNTTMKGMFPAGWTRKKPEKTIQYTTMIINGFITDQKKPARVPAYRVRSSRIAMV